MIVVHLIDKIRICKHSFNLMTWLNLNLMFSITIWKHVSITQVAQQQTFLTIWSSLLFMIMRFQSWSIQRPVSQPLNFKKRRSKINLSNRTKKDFRCGRHRTCRLSLHTSCTFRYSSTVNTTSLQRPILISYSQTWFEILSKKWQKN